MVTYIRVPRHTEWGPTIVCLYLYLVVFLVDLPSVLWYCWLGLLTCKNRLPYNLYCVGGDVKHCSLTHPQGSVLALHILFLVPFGLPWQILDLDQTYWTLAFCLFQFLHIVSCSLFIRIPNSCMNTKYLHVKMFVESLNRIVTNHKQIPWYMMVQ